MADITEAIEATENDVLTLTRYAPGGFYSARSYVRVARTQFYSGRQGGGFRFQGVAVDQGATIGLAELKLYQIATEGIVSARIHGDDVDDAAAWAGTNRPAGVTKTTANTVLTVGTNGTVVAHDVTEIVQEIVDRAGWASGNDMRFAILGEGTNNFNVFIEDFSAAGANQAVLEITLATPDAGSVGSLINGGLVR